MQKLNYLYKTIYGSEESMRTLKIFMSDSCNQTSTLSNTAEIVENESRFKLSPLLLNKARFPGWANLFNFLVDILSKQFPCFLLY